MRFHLPQKVTITGQQGKQRLLTFQVHIVEVHVTAPIGINPQHRAPRSYDVSLAPEKLRWCPARKGGPHEALRNSVTYATLWTLLVPCRNSQLRPQKVALWPRRVAISPQ